MKYVTARRFFLPLFLLTALAVSLPADGEPGTAAAAMTAAIGKPVRMKTTQGGVFHGILKLVAEDRIEIVADDGQILQIDLESVEEFTVIEEKITKETFFQDSAANRLIVMPTGFPMETGEFHVADQEIIAVTVSYGLNEHASFWAGLSIPGFLVSARYIFSPSDSFALSVGSFAGLSWMENLKTGVILPYLIGSWGEPNNNITVGASPIVTFDYTRATPFELNGAVAALGGKMVLTASSSLIFENWIMWLKRDVYGGSLDQASAKWDAVPRVLLPAVVFRIAGQRLSWDIGAIIPLFITDSGYEANTGYRLQGIGGDAVIPLPILSVTYRID
ncbi:MAG: hypothetical protein JW852_00265 [Spirochaetales bacterium]|nr:hypothetical protein [Spirochaetales bacterium]